MPALRPASRVRWAVSRAVELGSQGRSRQDAAIPVDVACARLVVCLVLPRSYQDDARGGQGGEGQGRQHLPGHQPRACSRGPLDRTEKREPRHLILERVSQSEFHPPPCARARPSWEQSDAAGKTPLALAIEQKNHKMIELLFRCMHLPRSRRPHLLQSVIFCCLSASLIQLLSLVLSPSLTVYLRSPSLARSSFSSTASGRRGLTHSCATRRAGASSTCATNRTRAAHAPSTRTLTVTVLE